MKFLFIFKHFNIKIFKSYYFKYTIILKYYFVGAYNYILNKEENSYKEKIR